MSGSALPVSETLARALAEMDAQDRAEDRAREKRRAELEVRHEGAVPHTPAQSLAVMVAASEGKVLHDHEDVLRKASAAMDFADFTAVKGRHPRGCGCERCIVGRLGPMTPGYDYAV